MTGLKELFDFSRAEIFALSILLLMILVGGGILMYQNTTRSLPPELIFQTVRAAESNPTPRMAGVPAGDTTSVRKPELSTKSLLIDLNTAPAESLMMLPRVGKTISQRIIEYREKHGGFDSVGQVIEIKGIGKKTLEKIREYLTVKK